VDQYPSLPNAEHEIDALRQRFPTSATIVRTGAGATPSAYRQTDPEHFALIHFAAHAEANRERPLDSAVILSKHGDQYKLYARDVLETHLRAGLVTVSACESAGTKAYAGEGLVGFAWAFLHAGAKNVVAGLWKADDGSTAKLMEQMYTGIAAGAAPDRALHDAKLSLIHSAGNYHKPYYWGAFQVYRRSVR
jgi:CHAT domain-containing protein